MFALQLMDLMMLTTVYRTVVKLTAQAASR